MYIPRSVPISPTASPAQRFAHIIGMLCDAVAARGPGGVLPTPLLLLLWGRLRRMATRVTRAAARLAAGIQPRAPRPRPATPRPSRPQPLRLPRKYAWVVVEVPGTAAYGNYLQALLADPQMAPLAAIPSVRRMLNPLCQMLGIPKLPPLPPATPVPALPPRRQASAPPPPRPRRDRQTIRDGHPPPPPTAPVAA